MIDATDTQKIIIDQWRTNCNKGMTAEQALWAAQQYAAKMGIYDSVEMYKAIEVLALVSGTTLEVLCQNPSFAHFVEQTKTAMEAKEQFEKGILQRASCQDTVSAIRDKLAEIEDSINKKAALPVMKQQLADIQKTINKFSDTAETETRERSGKELFDRIKTVPHGYRCGIFGRTFPVETLSFIGARTSRGKTAAMSSVAIDAVFPANAEDKRKVLFITLEESDWQIARRFALCKAWRDADDATKTELLNVVNPYYRNGDEEQDRNDPKQAFNAWMRGDLKPDTPTNSVFIATVSKAKDDIIAAIERGDISIYEGAGASSLELRARLDKLEKDTVLLYDYIQLSPAEGGITDSYSKKTAVADANMMIINAIKSHRCVAIAGAQFNRQGTDKQSAAEASGIDCKVDIFSDSSFSDCGNVEQDAHIAIGIGWVKNDSGEVTSRYCELLKNREGGGVGMRKELDMRGIGYSYLKAGDKVTWNITNGETKSKKVAKSKQSQIEKQAVLQSRWDEEE